MHSIWIWCVHHISPTKKREYKLGIASVSLLSPKVFIRKCRIFQRTILDALSCNYIYLRRKQRINFCRNSMARFNTLLTSSILFYCSTATAKKWKGRKNRWCIKIHSVILEGKKILSVDDHYGKTGSHFLFIRLIVECKYDVASVCAACI